MTYFKINLNKLEDSSVIQKRAIQSLAVGVVLLLLLSTVLGFVLHHNNRMNHHLNGLKTLAQSIETEISTLQMADNYVGEKEVRSLYKLDTRRVFWAQKLEKVAEMVGKDVALTDLRYIQQKLYVQGVARAKKTKNNFNLISDFIDRLKAETAFASDFGRIEFTSSNRLNFMDQDILSFEILCIPN